MNKNFSRYIDHTLLKSDCTTTMINTLCKEAIIYNFSAVCVPPYFVKEATQMLEGERTKVATVIGFPMGYSTTAAKVEEVKRAIDDGADEVDVVINLCAVKANNWTYVNNDIDSMTRATHLRGKVIKIILETGLLTFDEIAKLCVICNKSDVNYVKTSTGYNGMGATVEIVKFLRQELKSSIKIKASGGIKNRQTAEALVEAGASRIGASSSIKIIEG